MTNSLVKRKNNRRVNVLHNANATCSTDKQCAISVATSIVQTAVVTTKFLLNTSIESNADFIESYVLVRISAGHIRTSDTELPTSA